MTVDVDLNHLAEAVSDSPLRSHSFRPTPTPPPPFPYFVLWQEVTVCNCCGSSTNWYSREIACPTPSFNNYEHSAILVSFTSLPTAYSYPISLLFSYSPPVFQVKSHELTHENLKLHDFNKRVQLCNTHLFRLPLFSVPSHLVPSTHPPRDDCSDFFSA